MSHLAHRQAVERQLERRRDSRGHNDPAPRKTNDDGIVGSLLSERTRELRSCIPPIEEQER